MSDKSPRKGLLAAVRGRLSKKKRLAVALALPLVVALFLSGGEEGGGSKIGGNGVLARVPLGLCERLEEFLDPAKEIPVAAAPTRDTPEISGEGIGETLWAVSLQGIVAPQTLAARLTSHAGQTLPLAGSDVVLMHRTISTQGTDTNHLTAMKHASGTIVWQKVVSGSMLGATSGHVWLAAPQEEDSSLVAAFDVNTGDLDACFGGHAASKDEGPPLFEIFDDRPSLGYDAGGIPLGEDLIVNVRRAYDDLRLQRLSPGGDVLDIPIPSERSFYRLLSATDKTFVVETFDELEGRNHDLDSIWSLADDLSSVTSESVSSPELAVVHQRPYSDEGEVPRTIGIAPDTGEENWRIEHVMEASLEVGGLHVSGSTAAISLTDFSEGGTWTILKTSEEERRIDDSYMSFAGGDLVGLIIGPTASSGPEASLVDLADLGAPAITVKDAVTVLGADTEVIVVEVDQEGEPWLIGISLKSESESESESEGGGGSGGSGEGGGDQGGGGGGSGGEGDAEADGESAPDV